MQNENLKDSVVRTAYFPLNPAFSIYCTEDFWRNVKPEKRSEFSKKIADAYFMSIEREQRQERSKTVRQIMYDDYMKKYGHGIP